MLGRAIRALTQLFGNPPAQSLGPHRTRGVEHFHWHLDLIPGSNRPPPSRWLLAWTSTSSVPKLPPRLSRDAID